MSILPRAIRRAANIRDRVELLKDRGTIWTWVTGGEPTDHDLWPLLEELRLCGKIAVATSGEKSLGAAARLVDFLSVSPHKTPAELVQRIGQLNLVPGLGGLRLADWEDFDASGFHDRYVTPLYSRHTNAPENVAECVSYVRRHQGWKLGTQAHKQWGLL